MFIKILSWHDARSRFVFESLLFRDFIPARVWANNSVVTLFRFWQNQSSLPILSRVDWKIKFAFVLEITLKIFWDATREESVLVRFNRPNNKIIFHNEPLIATTNATKSATKNQRGSLWSENQRCKVLILLLMVFSMVETRGIYAITPLRPWNHWYQCI